MGKTVTLTAEDGFELSAYRAGPEGEAKGSVVVVQEIYGVDGYIRDVCERFAADGFAAIAPALFDRVRRDVELAYCESGLVKGRELAQVLGWTDPFKDIRAAAKALRTDGKVGVVGFGWGGSVAWLAACRLDVAAAVVYSGRHIPQFPKDKPKCPVIIHFAENDRLIPEDLRAEVRAANPDVPIHLYPAGRGFDCERRKNYHEESARKAWRRTLDFFTETLS